MGRRTIKLWCLLLLGLGLLSCLAVLSPAAAEIQEQEAAVDEGRKLSAYYKSVDDSFDALTAFDRRLNATLATLQPRLQGVEKPSAGLGQVGLLYFERETRWQQGGLVEAKKYIVMAEEQTPSNRLEEKFAWTLQRGIIEAALGERSSATATFERALSLASKTSDSSRDRASALHHFGYMLLQGGSQSDASTAHDFFRESLHLSPCGSEAAYGRLRLIEAYAQLPEADKSSLGWLDNIHYLEAALASDLPENCEQEIAVDVRLHERVSPGVRLPPAVTLAEWALFRAEDALGRDREKAWAHLERALAQDKARFNFSKTYSLQASQAEVEAAMQQVTPDFWPHPDAKIGLPTRTPVLIVGFPRSGSTLLESMLDAHPAIHGMGESSFIPFGLVRMEREIRQLSDADATPGVIREIVNRHASQVLSAMKSRVVEEQARRLPVTSGGGEGNNPGYPPAIPPRRIVDKMLSNYRNIAHILLLFPNATIIHTTRDPLDTLFSCLTHRFYDDRMVYTLDQSTLAQEYGLYRALMRHLIKILPPDRILQVPYERLVRSPEATLRGVLEKMDIEWHPAVLSFYNSQRVVLTHSALQVKRPLYTQSLGAWRRYEAHLDKLVAEWGGVGLQVQGLGARPVGP